MDKLLRGSLFRTVGVHKKAILLVDEPDAHLEILRQKQVYEILKDVAERNGCQVVIATHSEVILDDAIDTNLTLLLHGEAVNLAKQQDMKLALRSFGIEHYYKAKVHPRILYIEGSTDIDMLRELADRLAHRAAPILNATLNCYYTRNINPDNTLENRLERAAGAFGDFRTHFHTIKRFVNGLKAIAIFDSDNQNRQEERTDELAICYWKLYELENYFITPDVLCRFAQTHFNETAGELFTPMLTDAFRKVVDRCLLLIVFAGDAQQLAEYHRRILQVGEVCGPCRDPGGNLRETGLARQLPKFAQ